MGEQLRRGPSSPNFEEAYEQLKLYRQAFATPMTRVNNRARDIIKQYRLSSTNAPAIVAQRHKRLQSIVFKLNRFETTNLSQMQDIGGVRVVLPNLFKVRLFEHYFPGRSVIEIKRKKDYLAESKNDGYRSLHLMLEYPNKLETIYASETVSIELQVRTRLQHCWATAVEMAGMMNLRSYKQGDWDEDWQKFFLLLSRYFYYKEQDLEMKPQELQALKAITNELSVIEKLQATSAIYSRVEDIVNFKKDVRSIAKTPKLFVLEISHVKRKLNFYPFEELSDALKTLSILEFKYQNVNEGQAILADVNEIKLLKQAYPNFFMDTSVVVRELKQILKN